MAARHTERTAMTGLRTEPSRMGNLLLAVAASLALGAHGNAEQPQIPVQGVTGTIATEGTIQDIDEAGHKILVKAADGIERLFHLGGRSTVHGGDPAGDETLRALKKGTHVVVHYTKNGDTLTAEEIDRLDAEGLKQMEGKVTSVNRSKRTISIKLANGTTQVLRLSERAAADVGTDVDRTSDGTATIIVYYNNEAGQPVVHYFKRVS